MHIKYYNIFNIWISVILSSMYLSDDFHTTLLHVNIHIQWNIFQRKNVIKKNIFIQILFGNLILTIFAVVLTHNILLIFLYLY